MTEPARTWRKLDVCTDMVRVLNICPSGFGTVPDWKPLFLLWLMNGCSPLLVLCLCSMCCSFMVVCLMSTPILSGSGSIEQYLTCKKTLCRSLLCAGCYFVHDYGFCGTVICAGFPFVNSELILSIDESVLLCKYTSLDRLFNRSVG